MMIPYSLHLKRLGESLVYRLTFAHTSPRYEGWKADLTPRLLAAGFHPAVFDDMSPGYIPYYFTQLCTGLPSKETIGDKGLVALGIMTREFADQKLRIQATFKQAVEDLKALESRCRSQARLQATCPNLAEALEVPLVPYKSLKGGKPLQCPDELRKALILLVTNKESKG